MAENLSRRGLLAGLLALIGLGIAGSDGSINDSLSGGGVVSSTSSYGGFGYDFGEAFGA